MWWETHEGWIESACRSEILPICISYFVSRVAFYKVFFPLFRFASLFNTQFLNVFLFNSFNLIELKFDYENHPTAAISQWKTVLHLPDCQLVRLHWTSWTQLQQSNAMVLFESAPSTRISQSANYIMAAVRCAVQLKMTRSIFWRKH